MGNIFPIFYFFGETVPHVAYPSGFPLSARVISAITFRSLTITTVDIPIVKIPKIAIPIAAS